jgi:DNA-directed RNA polymerase specialized sigma24 family protein
MTIQEVGPFHESNSYKLDAVSPVEWEIALRKAQKHLNFRLRYKTSFGAHTSENLGVPAKEYYLTFAYLSLIYGKWEWKDKFDLTQQLIRMIDSRISTVVETYKKAREKNENRKNEGKYLLTTTEVVQDIESTFYDLEGDEEINMEDFHKAEEEYRIVEEFIAECEDNDIVLFWQCVKEGFTRKEIAEFIEKTPKQLDKIKEKFLNQIKKKENEYGNQ